MTHDSSSEPQKAFIVAAAVLLGLPFIVVIGMAVIVMAAGAGYIPGASSGLSGETTSTLLLFFVVWGVLSVVAVLIFVARVLRSPKAHKPN